MTKTDLRDDATLAAIRSLGWPASDRNGGRLEIGIGGRLRRNPQSVHRPAQTHGPASTLNGVLVPDGTSRAVLVVRLPGHTVTAEVAAKSLSRAVAAIAEYGVDGVACLVQGRLDGGAIVEADISAMPKAPKPAQAANE